MSTETDFLALIVSPVYTSLSLGIPLREGFYVNYGSQSYLCKIKFKLI